MSLGAEERLVLSCARTAPSPTDAEVLRLLEGPLEWDRVFALSAAQGVAALVARSLAIRHADRLPEPVVARALDEARAAARESLRLAGALVELVALLDRAGARALPFKGPTLALQAYGDPGLRSFADLDLLVRPAELGHARAALLGAGFVPSYPSTPARRALLVRRGSHESFERADGTLVELHWRIAARVSDFGLDYDRLWRRIGTVELAGRAVPALAADDLLLVLALHGAKHAWERLAWICDVAELLRAAPTLDWGALRAEAARMRAERVLGLALRLASDLLDAPLPPAVAVEVGADRALGRLAGRVRAELFRPPRAGAGTLRFHLATRPGWPAKLDLALGALTSLNQRDLEAVSLPDAALPLYYLARPARLAGKAVAHALRRPPS